MATSSATIPGTSGNHTLSAGASTIPQSDDGPPISALTLADNDAYSVRHPGANVGERGGAFAASLNRVLPHRESRPHGGGRAASAAFASAHSGSRDAQLTGTIPLRDKGWTC